MKKRLLSLVLCLVMVFSLLPFASFAARPEGNEDGFQSVGSRTWTPNDIATWAPSAGQNAYGRTGYYLYYKDGDNYRLLNVDNDPDYYTQGSALTISSTFSTKPSGTSTGTGNGKYETASSYYYLDANNQPHTVYYNTYLYSHRDTGMTNWSEDFFYSVQLYYYKNTKDSTGAVTDYASMGTALSNGTVALLSTTGASTSGTNNTWLFGYYYNDNDCSSPSSYSTTVSGLYNKDTANSKKMVTYKVGSTDVYFMRNTTSSDQPTYTGELYYMVDPAVWHDPETIPVDDPDPAASSQTVQNGTIINNPGRVNDNGLKLSKNLSTADGEKFDITMESYSTANTTKTAVTEKVPTDFVLVVDQSGSMSDSDMPTGYQMISGSRTLEQIAGTQTRPNGETDYYVLGEDGNYYRVYAVRDYLFRYYPANYWYSGSIVEHLGKNLSWFMGESEATTNFENQFYFREVVNGVTYYQPITTTVSGEVLTYYVKFHFNSKLTGGAGCNGYGGCTLEFSYAFITKSGSESIFTSGGFIFHIDDKNIINLDFGGSSRIAGGRGNIDRSISFDRRIYRIFTAAITHRQMDGTFS